jgi:hypothetical protein
MTPEFLAALQAFTTIAAAVTAVVNLVAVFVKGKVDPSALKVVEKLAVETTKTTRSQAKRVDKVRGELAGRLDEMNTLLVRVETKLNS